MSYLFPLGYSTTLWIRLRLERRHPENSWGLYSRRLGAAGHGRSWLGRFTRVGVAMARSRTLNYPASASAELPAAARAMDSLSLAVASQSIAGRLSSITTPYTCFALETDIFPSTTSSSTALGSRARGLPQPPPPGHSPRSKSPLFKFRRTFEVIRCQSSSPVRLTRTAEGRGGSPP